MPEAIRTTRFAPSPTGTLHLGNLRTFMVNWALARQNGWRILMRIEDLDRQRVRSGAAEQALQLFEWLGLDFDVGPVYQFADLEPYRAAMRHLTADHLAYACALTRAQIQQAVSAPHGGDVEQRFPPEVRPSDRSTFQFSDEAVNYRFTVTDEPVEIEDQIAGVTTYRPFDDVGDFLVWTKLGVPSYQLAVVVDDARHGITDVVRGDDLLPSAARQTLLYRALNHAAPRWWHLPMVFDADGQRLAKRNNQSHVGTYHARGVRPERIIGLLAAWSGICEKPCEMSAADFRERFRVDRLCASRILFTPEQHSWLVAEH